MKEILDFRTIFQYGEWFKIKIENVRSNVHKNPYPFILHKWFVIPIVKQHFDRNHEYTNSQTYSLKALRDKGHVVTDISESIDFKKKRKLRFDECH